MNIGIVLVTFNRLNELKKTVRLYEQQTKRPAYILVVDNHSTDGTDVFLKEWTQEESAVRHEAIYLPANVGGSGGFHAGTEAALRMDADWIWLADDDAYPDLRVLEVLENFAERHPDLMARTASLCTKNRSANRIVTGHRCRVQKTPLGAQIIPVADAEYEKEYFPLDIYSFVGAVVRKEVLEKAGLPNRDFFIYADDAEHALRVRKYGDILCVPEADVFHLDNNNYSREASWRDYYATKNILLTYKWHLGGWSYFVRGTCRMLTAFRSMNPEKIRLFLTAIWDAQTNKVGLHPVYKPGWQPTRKYSK